MGYLNNSNILNLLMLQNLHYNLPEIFQIAKSRMMSNKNYSK